MVGMVFLEILLIIIQLLCSIVTEGGVIQETTGRMAWFFVKVIVYIKSFPHQNYITN